MSFVLLTRIFQKLIVFFGVLLVFKCTDPVSVPTYYKENLVVGGINWVFRNTPSDLNSLYSLAVDFNIKYSGVNLSHTQIEYVRVKNRSILWTFNNDSSLVNDSLKIIGYGNYYCYSTKYTSNASVLPVDSFVMQIGFKNGEVIERNFGASIPGCQNANGYRYVYTQDFTGSAGSSYRKALARPVGNSAKKVVDTIVVSFSINDTSAYNGNVDFYDANNVSVLNSTKLFRDYKSKKITAYINDGAGFYTNGQLNTVKLPLSVFVFKTGKRISDISYARVFVTDGSQFANESSNSYRESCNFISMSPKVIVY